MAGYKKKLYKKKKPAAKRAAKAPLPKVTRNLNMVTLGTGFPKKIKVLHKYSHITTGSSPFGVPVTLAWSANGLYDPYQAAPSDRPMYWNQMVNIYDHYCVIASKATFIISLTGTKVPSIAGVFVNDDLNNTTNTLKAYIEQSQGRYISINDQSGPMKCSMKFSASKYYGKNVLSNNSLQGDNSSNPTEGSFYTLYFGAMDNTSTQTFVVQVIIEYIAIWKELKDIAPST